MPGIEGLEVDLDLEAPQLLLAAAHHDLESLRTLLRTVSPNVQDADTGYTALHTAIAACADDEFENGETQERNSVTELDADKQDSLLKAEKTLKLLFQNGAIWNDLDNSDETPGCLAWRLGLKSLYEIIVDAGVRAELLLNRLDAFEPLSDATDDEDDDDDDELDAEASDAQPDDSEDASTADSGHQDGNDETRTATHITSDESTLNENYLQSSLSFSDNRLLDSSANGVMMSWESDIMRRTAKILLPRPGLRILNVGHGMGIFDKIAQECAPGAHHIVEAHPAVLAKMRESGWLPPSPSSGADAATRASSQYSNVTVHEGRWQDVLPGLLASDQMFDAIFFDTFAEPYAAFRDFFGEHVVSLLDAGGVWSFFHGLGADRQVCYDVYTKVVEMDLFEAGFDVDWESVDVPDFGAEGERRGSEWQGVRRRYWNCEKYRLPICRFTE